MKIIAGMKVCDEFQSSEKVYQIGYNKNKFLALVQMYDVVNIFHYDKKKDKYNYDNYRLEDLSFETVLERLKNYVGKSLELDSIKDIMFDEFGY
jgi:hypothetical protein